MTQEEIIKLAAEAGFKWPDICETTIEQRLERFANLVAVAEREKCTGTQEFVTLPREVVKRVMDALYYTSTTKSKHPNQWKKEDAAMKELRAALEQPQNHIEHHLGMVPAGWKLVPVEPKISMKQAALNASRRWAECDAPLPRTQELWASEVCWKAMLSAAPQPPTTEDSSVVQPQADQPAMTPIAQRKLEGLVASGYTISGYSIYHEQKHQHGFVTGAGLVGWWRPEGVEHVQPLGEQKLFAWISPRALEWGTRQSEKVVKLACKAQPEYDFTEPLYTRPQPKREPLTDEEINKLCPQFDDPMRREMWIIGFKAAHGIK